MGGAPRRVRRIRSGEIPRPEWRGQRVVQPVTDEQPVERSPGFTVAGRSVDLDAVFAFALFTPMLFIGKLQTAGAALAMGLVPLYLFVRREKLLRTLAPRSFLFAIPAFALFSVVWSQAPAETLKYAGEYWGTVTAGLLLSSARNQEAVLRAIAIAFQTYVAAALAFGGYVAVGSGAGGEAFSGLSESKNLIGDIASTGLIVTTVVAVLAIRGRSIPWFAFAALSIVTDLVSVVAARSAGALLGLGIGVAAVVALTPLVFAGKAVRGWLTSVLAVILLMVGLSYRWLAQSMIDLGATLFDKDQTLTGRTYLWYRASDLIREHPLAGRGFSAFWMQGNTDAEGLWQYFNITERGGFTFHNTYVEILVTLGWLGLAVIALTVLIGVGFLIKRFVERPTPALVFWIGVLLYELARTPIETIGVAPLYFSTALMFGALGAAFGRTRVPRATRPTPPTAEPRQGPSGGADARVIPLPGAFRIMGGKDRR
jgi:exopolysaccharide production protein ExoQ